MYIRSPHATQVQIVPTDAACRARAVTLETHLTILLRDGTPDKSGERERGRQAGRQAGRQTDRQTEKRERERERERERQRERDREIR